jgi:hypothetical protein
MATTQTRAYRRNFLGLFDAVIEARQTLDPVTLDDGETQAIDVTVTGAAVGDFVLIAPGVDVDGIVVSATIKSANTVEIVLQNETTAEKNLASSTWNLLVLKVRGRFGRSPE